MTLYIFNLRHNHFRILHLDRLWLCIPVRRLWILHLLIDLLHSLIQKLLRVLGLFIMLRLIHAHSVLEQNHPQQTLELFFMASFSDGLAGKLTSGKRVFELMLLDDRAERNLVQLFYQLSSHSLFLLIEDVVKHFL